MIDTKVNHSNRSNILDCIRGFAVILMVIFHLGYDLSYFKFVSINFFLDKFWFYLPRLIVLLFMISVGISLNLKHNNTMYWKSFIKRAIKLAVAAIMISLFTFFVFPTNWIYFGTLHCILFTSILALPFIGKKWASLLCSLCILLLWIIDFQVPWFKFTQSSLDYIPPYPWFGFVTLGIFLQSIKFDRLRVPDGRLSSFLTYFGKHSLIFYLIHQPILFGLVFCAHKLLH